MTLRRAFSFALGMLVVASALTPFAAPAPAAAATNTALQLNGSTQYATLGTASQLRSATFTVELWFKRTGAGAGTSTGSGGIASAIPLIAKGRAEAETTAADINYFFGIDATTNRLVADFEEAPAGTGTDGANHPITGTAVIATDGVWHHAAATYDGISWNLYLDGALDGTLAVNQPANALTNALTGVGSALTTAGAAAGFFAGAVDEVRIWSVARSQAQIQADKNNEISVPTAGLIGRWGLNEGIGSSLADSGGANITGATVASPTWVAGFKATDNTALQLNGSTQYATLGTASQLRSATFTVELWFKRTGAGAGTSTGSGGIASAIPLIAKGRAEAETTAADINYFFGIDATTNRLVADFEEAPAGTGTDGANHPITGTAVIATDGVWHHAAATYDGISWNLYLDGALDGTLAVNQPANALTNALTGVGSALTTAGAAAGFFAGAVDEVRIWSVARSQAQIQADKNNEISVPTAGLIGRWGLNEGIGSSLADSGGANITGATVASPTWVAGFVPPVLNGAPSAPTVIAPANGATGIGTSPTLDVGVSDPDSDPLTVTFFGRPLASGNFTQIAQNTNVTTATTSAAWNAIGAGQTFEWFVTVADAGQTTTGPTWTFITTPSADPVFVGAGDIADCTRSQDSATAAVISGVMGAVWTAGDNVYPEGTTLSNWTNCYEPTWGGAIKARTRPTPGNHDWGTNQPGPDNLDAYNTYFGSAATDAGGQSYYSYDLPSNWHVVNLDSECQLVPGGCGVGSPQELWLRADLAANSTENVVAIWHRPLFGSGTSSSALQPLYEAIYEFGVDILLVGHDHFYERVIPLNPDEEADPTHGIRQFTVGTGGAAIGGFSPSPLTEAGSGSAYGVLKLTLHATTYDWKFLPIAGLTFTDSGTASVHAAPPQDLPPAAPTNLAATASSAGIGLDWDANSEPDLAGYNVYRSTSPGVSIAGPPLNGSPLTSPSYTDGDVTDGVTYHYVVTAVDATDHESGASNEDSATGIGSGLKLGSSGAYVTFGDPAKLDLATFTVETWFKRTGIGTPNTTGTGGITIVPLLTHGAPEAEGSNVDANWILGINTAGNVIAADFEAVDDPAPTGQNVPISGITAITDDVWHHAAATFNGTTWAVYLDGNLEASVNPGLHPRSDSTQRVALGTMITTADAALGRFDGVIDEARVWSVARSTAQINASKDLELTSGTGLVARWALNDAGGTTVADSMTTPANGTITGSGFAWVAGAPVTPGAGNETPGLPTLNAPTNGATGVSLSPTLDVSVADPDTDPLTVTFFGRPLASGNFVQVDQDTGVPSGTNTTATWSNLGAGQTFEWFVTVSDGVATSTGPTWTFHTVSSADPVFVGTGDIASCDVTTDTDVGNLIAGIDGHIWTTGDNVYPNGTAADFSNCYAPTPWGSVGIKSRTRPVPGNHDWGLGATNSLAGYIGYYGAAATDADGQSYYSYDIPASNWHIVNLDTECALVGGCNVGSPQEVWLKADLAANSSKNVIAVWHKPRYSSGATNLQTLQPLWDALYAAGVDILLDGHDHIYERTAPMRSGATLASPPVADPTFGIRQFTVGTGGEAHHGLATPLPTSQVRDDENFGILKLTLHATTYDWVFLPIAGSTFTDSGTGTVHAAPNGEPTFNQNLGNRTDPENAGITLSAAATDPDGDDLTYAATGLPTGLSIDSGTGLITGTIAFTAASGSPWNVSITVRDGATVDDTDTFTWTVTNVNRNPTFNQNLPDRTDPEDASIALSAAATDPDLDPLTYAATGLPTGLSIDTGTGIITGTIAAGAAGGSPWHVEVTVRDGTTVDATDLFDWTVTSSTPGSGIELRAAANGANTKTTTLVLPRPSGTVSGDVLLASVALRSTTAITAPAGWTLVRVDPRATVFRQAVYVHVAGGAEPASYTWTFASARPAVGTIAAYSGVDGANPIVAHSGIDSAGSASITAPSLTTTVPDTRLVGFFGIVGTTTIGPPAGMTERTEVVTPAGTSNPLTASLDDQPIPASGATGSRVATAAISAANIGQLVALRPGGGGPPGNSPPTAADLAVSTPQDTALGVTLAATDDSTCELTFSIVTGPTHGSLGAIGPNPCASNSDTASVLYTPTAAYVGPDSFTYRAFDGTDFSAPATVSITVTSSTPGSGIELRAAANGANTKTTTLVLPRPSGTVSGDVLLASVALRSTTAITAPAGWTLVRVDPRATVFRQAVYVHVAGGAEPASYTWTFASARPAVGTIAAYSGVDGANPIVAHSGIDSAGSASITAPSLTTTVPDTRLVGFFGIVGTTTIGPPAGMTERTEVVTPAGTSNPLTASLDDQPIPASGATGSRVATAAISAANIGQLVALRPGGGGPPGNSPPTAADLAVSTPQDTALGVTLAATDDSTCELTFSIVTGPTHGSLGAIGPNPCASNSDTASVLYTPTAAYVGPDSFTYRAFDGTDFSAPATVSITVTSSTPGSGIELRAAANGANTKTTTLVLPRPSGTVSGDVLLASVALRSTTAITAPAGWTLVRVDPRATVFRQAVYVHVAGGAEPASYTWTFASARPAVGTIAAYSGVDGANPIVAHSGIDSAGSASITAPSLTTTVPDTRLVGFFGIVGTTTIGPPAGMTERTEVVTPAGTSNPLTASLDDQPIPASGATGSRVATAAISAANIGQLVALRPAP